MREVMARFVDAGEVPGLVALVSRRGDVEAHVIGALALGGPPLPRNAIFRISSMTKPIIAAAAMVLVDEGRLRLDEPVDRLLPELANRRVLRALDAPVDDTVPAARAITVEDLLSFRFGFGMVFAPPDRYPIQRAEAALGTMALAAPKPRPTLSPDEWMRRFATLPLMKQPGEAWLYNTGAQVLGVLIARASGQPLQVFLRARIFEPLGMVDTAFTVPVSKLDRYATAYARGPGGLVVVDGVADSQWTSEPSFPDGGAGLVSTADDCLAFARMMLAGGAPILSAASARAMMTDHLTPQQRADAAPFLGGRGWGLGLGVGAGGEGSPSGCGWDGGFGTSYAWDPARDLAGVLMTQRVWDSPAPPDVYRSFWTAARR